jgi:hypothetical protein
LSAITPRQVASPGAGRKTEVLREILLSSPTPGVGDEARTLSLGTLWDARRAPHMMPYNTPKHHSYQEKK